MSAPLLVLIDFSLTVKVTTFIFIPGRGSAIPSAKEGKSGKINTLLICFRAVQTCVHARIQEFSPGGVQARLPENSSDNVFLFFFFFSPRLIYSFTVVH